MNNKYYVTIEGYKKLCDEIDLQDVLHDEVEKEMGRSVKRDNDLRENPEYMELRVKAMYGIPTKKKELLMKYQSAEIIEQTKEYLDWDEKTVIRKCIVTIDYEGDVETYTILGANEGDIDNNILSCESPLVLALLGLKEGETTYFNGSKIKVLSVKRVSYDKEVEKQICKKL